MVPHIVGPDMIKKRTIVTRALNPSSILLQMLLTIHSGFLKQKEVVVSVKMFPLWWLIIGHQLSSVTFLPLSQYKAVGMAVIIVTVFMIFCRRIRIWNEKLKWSIGGNSSLQQPI